MKAHATQALSLAVAFLVLCGGSIAAQHSRQALMQPDCRQFNLRSWPVSVTAVQQYHQGDDVNFEETYLFDTTGHLSEYRKRGFGGQHVTTYPLTMEQLQGGSDNPSRLYTFDFDGDIVEMRHLDMKGRLSQSTHYIYALDGHLMQTVEYDYDTETGAVAKRTVADYDKHEHMVSKMQYTADELLLWKEKLSYDRRGNLVKRIQTFYHDEETDTTVEQRSYTYDSRGNWTECRHIINGRPVYTTIRTIIY